MAPSEKDIGKKWNLNVIEFALEREGYSSKSSFQPRCS